MKIFFSRVIALCLVGSVVISQGAMAANDEVNTNDPYEMIKQVSNMTFDRFKSDNTLINNDLSHLKV
ncbi:MAG: phospholipid transport system substrate-binding protein, partial [Shewanella psychromarinicola]